MNKTIIYFSFLTLLFAGRLSAQAPSQINYQAALRNTETGVELSNQQVFMLVKFLNGGPEGDIVYQEEHINVSTSLYGIINIQLGNGSPIQGNFTSIPWSTGDIWLDLEVDAGKGLQSIGTTKFSSVPYALYAADAPQTEPDGDGDSTNEIQDLIFSDNVLTISNNNSATPIDLSGFVNTPDDDSDPTNEIQDLSLSGNTLRITGNTEATNIDLTPYVNVPDADSDPTNELITAFDYDPVTAIISITEAGITRTQDLSNLAGGGGPDEDADPTNEIQDLNLTGTTLKITGNPSATNIDLSGYKNVPNLDNDPTNEIQDLNLTGTTLKITGNSSATDIDLSTYKNVPNLDNDPTNEIQDLILTGNNLKISGNASANNINLGVYRQDLELTGNTLKITGNPSPTNINLSPYVNVPNLDNDPTNEIQDLNLTGTTLKITGNSSATPIDLSGFKNVPNLDNDPSNEIQNLSLTGTTLKITGNPSATPIDLSTYKNVPNLDNDPTNEIQDLTLTGTTLKITGNSSATNIDLSTYKNVPNLDNDPTNEIQDLNLIGTILKITGNSSATNIDLSTYKNVPNLDNDPTNEIQDLSISNHIIKITGNSSATAINLSQYQNQELPQGQIFVGNAASVATPQAVTGDLSMTDAGDITVIGLSSIPISDVAPTNGQKLAYNSGSNLWVPVSDASLTPITKYYSVDPMDFVELTNAPNDVELDKHNALKYYNENAPFAMIYKSSINKLGAPVHLPDGATITGVTFYIRDIGNGDMVYSLKRKRMDTYSATNDVIASGTSVSSWGNLTRVLTVNANNVVDNSLYNYRIFVTITDDEDDKDEPINGIQQAIYGVKISYQ